MRISSGPSATPLSQQGRGESSGRWSAETRAQIYQRVLGSPGGTSGEASTNRDFNDLWLRFVSSVAQFTRQQSASSLLARTAPPSLSSESVQRMARDLATKLGPSIADAWSARDSWQVVDRVASMELGGATNSARYRTMAEAGGAILERLAHISDGSNSVDEDLVNAAEQWLAVTSTSDAEVESLSQPEAAERVTAFSQSLFAALSRGDTPLDLRAPKGAVLFSGPSGTGKTLAAHWLATSLGRDLQRIDLSQVVSKYIGETEKNLAAIFKDAERSGAVLLFDEADALFGKRTDVRDAHARYANQEANFLLQQIESYAGVAILTTNEKAKIDPDLLKKLRAVVAFPLPPKP